MTGRRFMKMIFQGQGFGGAFVLIICDSWWIRLHRHCI